MEEMEQKPPRKASTVILLSRKSDSFEVYLLRRSEKSHFMPGHYVFPGGTVDPEDMEVAAQERHPDTNPDRSSEQEILAHAVTAVREAFEEAGILFFRNEQPGAFERICDLRRHENLSKGWFRDWVLSEGAVLDTSSLFPWSHWVTPAPRPTRYDTLFFAAFLPAGQDCVPDGHETTEGVWMNPEAFLKLHLNRKIMLSPPTLTTLNELYQFRNTGDLKNELASRTWGDVRQPRPIPVKDGVLLLLPWDPMYHQDVITGIRKNEWEPAPLGETFSRILFREGRWEPVR